MINKIKSFASYILIFVASVLLLAGFLFISAYIPQNWIQKHMEESADILCEHNRIWYMLPGVESSQNHLYADAITANIAYHLSDDNPLESVMWARYYWLDGDVNTSFRTAVRDHLEAETQYLRYWHGSAAVVRLLHIFLNITQIYWLHAVVILGLLIAVLTMLCKNHMFAEAAAFAFSMIMVSIWFVPFCLEYTWTFLCMLVASLIGIRLVMNGKRNQLGMLFLITGMVTVYLDFLSTETLTLVIPLLLILRVVEKQKGNTTEHNNPWIFTLKCSVLWAIGYVGMWVSKWLIASAVLHENVMPYVRSHIGDRIGGVNPVGSLFGYIAGSIIRNVKCLLPFDYGMIGAAILLVTIAVFIVLPVVMDKVTVRSNIDKKIIALYFLIGGIPILRFAVLRNHSWYHRSFTFRALAGTLLALCFIITELIEWKRINGHT